MIANRSRSVHNIAHLQSSNGITCVMLIRPMRKKREWPLVGDLSTPSKYVPGDRFRRYLAIGRVSTKDRCLAQSCH